MKKIIYLFLMFTILSCNSDNNEPELQNQLPTATLTIAVDDAKITGTLTGTDSDGTITTKTIKISNSSGVVVETINVISNSFSSGDLTNDNYTVIGTVTDNDGGNATDSDSITINVIVDTFTYEFNQTITSTPENNTGAIVIGSINQIGTLDFTTSEFTDGGSIFELFGNDIQIKSSVALDFETATSHSFTLLLKRTGETDITLNGTVTVTNVDESTENKLCGGHGVIITITNDNGDILVIDENGNVINTFDSEVANIGAINSSLAGGNLNSLATGVTLTTFSSFNLSYNPTGAGVIRPDGNSMTLTGFGRLMQVLYNHFITEYGSSALPQDDLFKGIGITSGDSHGYQWRVIYMYAVENIANVVLATGESLNDNEIITQIFLDTVRSMDGKDNTAAQGMFNDFVAENFTGGIACD